MTITLSILGGLIVIVILLLIRKKRKKRKEVFQSGEKHPNGFIKYHKETKIRVKSSLSDSDSKKEESKSVAYFRFKGDIKAQQRYALSRAIDEIVLNKDKIDRAIIVVESPGGSVTEYGSCYSEIKRIRDAGVQLEVCIDTVAASGGYLMSLPANKIIASPFSMIGSIGVVSFVPNIRKLLEKFDIQPRTFTSGKFKRTVTLTDDASPEEIERYTQQLGLIHAQFKQALKQYRPQVDLDRVATGEAWLSSTSVEENLELVDELACSSEYLLSLNKTLTLVEFHEEIKQSPLKKWLKMKANSIVQDNIREL